MQQLKKYGFIDGLRGVAILLVMFAHVGMVLPPAVGYTAMSVYGKYGVQLFFVLSAFTLCHSLERTATPSKVALEGYWIKRWFRIAPLYYLAIPIYYIFLKLNPHATNWILLEDFHAKNIVANLLFVHGFIASANNSIVPGGWSIGCEFAFYAIFPFLFWYLFTPLRLIGSALASYGLLFSVMWLRWKMGREFKWEGNTFLHFFIGNQMICFLLGMAVYKWRQTALFKTSLTILVLPALMGLLYINQLKWGWVLSPVLAAIVLSNVVCFCFNRNMPNWLQSIGRHSFSMYILHFMFVWWIARLPILNVQLQPWIVLPLLVLLVWGISAIVHRFIEQPGIDQGHRIAQKLHRRFEKPAAV